MTAQPTVFVVDDDPAVRRSLSALIQTVFPRVETYGSALEFLAVYQPEQPGCLVLDVAMPGITGLELQRKLNHQRNDLPVVFISAHGNVPMAVRAMEAGAVTFLEKPVKEEQLFTAIRKALELDAQNRRRKARRKEVERRLALLTAREREVLDLIVEGKYNKEIAVRLGVSIRTIEDRRARVMKKMGADSVAELVRLAMS